jgi:hypothetical protein
MKCFVMDRDTYRAILMGATIKKRELYDQVRSPVVVQCALLCEVLEGGGNS